MGVSLPAAAAVMMQSSPPVGPPRITRLRPPGRDYGRVDRSLWPDIGWSGDYDDDDGRIHLVHLRITAPPGATEIGWRRWVSSGGGPLGAFREPDPPPARPLNWRTVTPGGHVDLMDLPDPPSYTGWRIRAWGASGSRVLGPHRDSVQY